MPDSNVNLWASPEHALAYLNRADRIPHRTEGEATLLECLPRLLPRVLDLGSGDGRLLALVKLARPHAEAVAVDFSEAMLERLRARFAKDPNLEHVASPTEALHAQFLAAIGVEPGAEDPSNKLLGLETQLGWLRAIGFEDVDCQWKWRELALLVGTRPSIERRRTSGPSPVRKDAVTAREIPSATP
jgi:tRNA (cmo5U34)-methyltransferase